MSEMGHGQLCELVPEFAAKCDRLASFGIPETLQHDDFHDGNIFIRDGRYLAPTAPGFSAEMTPEALTEHQYPSGAAWV